MNMPDKSVEETPTNPPVVVNMANIQTITSTFDGLLAILKDVDLLQNTSFMDAIFKNVGELTTEDMRMMSKHFYNTFTKMGLKKAPTLKSIEKHVNEYLDKGRIWEGHSYVGERDCQIFVIPQSKKDMIFISNFILVPVHKIRVLGKQANLYHVYDVYIKGDKKPQTLMLTSNQFNQLDSIQAELLRQLPGHSVNINNCQNYMKDIFYKYVTLAEWSAQKTGTSIIGLERLENDGPKYFCTPEAIFNADGVVSKELRYMGNEQSNEDEIRTLANLQFDEEKWRKQIAPMFLTHVLGLNEKSQMMNLIGWIGAIPHDYVLRKESGTGFFPHFHIIGEPGSGKSTIMNLIKQFMGHSDSMPRSFSSAFETQKLLNTSYTIPAVIDEYAKRWSPQLLDAINKVLVESFNRSYFSKGKSDQTSVYYKYKNPLLMGGQVPTSDLALATRLVQMKLKKSFHVTSEGKRSMQNINALQSMEDKNFWVGYCLWAAQFSNSEVKDNFTRYRTLSHKNIPEESRVADIYAMVMLGLHYMKKLADELNVDIGYSEEDINDLPKQIASSSIIQDLKEGNSMYEFLKEVANLGIAHGNKNNYYGNNFGVGLSVMPSTPQTQDAGQWGGDKNKQPACIYGKDLILIKVEDMVKVLNRGKKPTETFDSKEVLISIEDSFASSLQNPESQKNLVLAPKQFKNTYGRYTAFSRDVLTELFPEFAHLPFNDGPLKIKGKK